MRLSRNNRHKLQSSNRRFMLDHLGNLKRTHSCGELRAENIITSKEASIPGVLVEDSATARAQAEVIKQHTLGTWGPYSELPREDPRRAQFIDGVTLRTSLNMAVMGFGITDLVIAVALSVVSGHLLGGSQRRVEHLRVGAAATEVAAHAARDGESTAPPRERRRTIRRPSVVTHGAAEEP